MMNLEHEVATLREDLVHARASHRRLVRTLLVTGSGVLVAGTVGVILFVGGVARTDPAMATACNPARTTQSYCFAGGTPALASQVNSNFEFAYSSIDALSASKFDKGAQYSPNYTTWGTSPQGAGGAAIANDDGTYKKLMVVGNTSAGGAREVGIWDNLTVSQNLTVNGSVTVNGRTNLGIYVNGCAGAQGGNGPCSEVDCNAGDIAISGGGDCGTGGDTLLLEDRPALNGSGRPVGWHVLCENHDTAFSWNPWQMYVVCVSHAQ